MTPGISIVPIMKRDRVVAGAALLGSVAWLTCGCGGVSGSHSVSPASFFLPGLIQHEPAVPPSGPVPGIDVTPVSPEAARPAVAAT